ncbi:DUF4012 domain-containing protein [Microbacterium testaceum]|uniref:DUF4012 domain-containing protein n=1 Tax=Microbacterium testaceum TaxID=2033 RepID=UPI002AC6C131|nr:DUF4012 domain-containing protein [Microbacterium testaceum]MDZ5146135.1 DUF4012 domain-containing protein [Microbacterium testaceum]
MRSTRRLKLLVIWTVVVAVLAVGGAAIAGAALLAQAQEARGHLVAARDAAESLGAAVRGGDAASVQALSESMSRELHTAEDIVSTPLWTVAAAVPWVGPNLDAVRAMTRAGVVIDEQARVPGVEIMTDLSTESLATAGAGVDLAPFRRAEDALPQISAAVGEANATLSDIDTTAVVPEVAEAVKSFSAALAGVQPMVQNLHDTLPTLLDMAGGNGGREYLVIFQNNAEARATGGNPSAMALLRVADGRATLDEQADSSTFYAADLVGKDIVDVAPQVRALYESDTWQFPQNYTRTPDFPSTAHMFDALWTKSTGTTVDGVISLDPVALAHVLEVTGPVTLSDGSAISADTAVSLLLRDTYERFGSDGGAADKYFEQVVRNVFEVIAQGRWSPIPMVEALSRGVTEHRTLAWMRNPDEQAAVERAGMSGTFAPAGRDVGVFINDSSHSKLEYYLSKSINVDCDKTTGLLSTTITLTSTAPAEGLPAYAQGQRNRRMGLPGSTMLLDVVFFATPGNDITLVNPLTGAVPAWVRSGVDGGRAGHSVTVALAAGQTMTVSAVSTFDPSMGVDSVRFTPGVSDTPVSFTGGCS